MQKINKKNISVTCSTLLYLDFYAATSSQKFYIELPVQPQLTTHVFAFFCGFLLNTHNKIFKVKNKLMVTSVVIESFQHKASNQNTCIILPACQQHIVNKENRLNFHISLKFIILSLLTKYIKNNQFCRGVKNVAYKYTW